MFAVFCPSENECVILNAKPHTASTAIVVAASRYFVFANVIYTFLLSH